MKLTVTLRYIQQYDYNVSCICIYTAPFTRQNLMQKLYVQKSKLAQVNYVHVYKILFLTLYIQATHSM